MDTATLQAAIDALAPLCTKPGQQLLLNQLRQQPPELMEMLLANAASNMSPSTIPAIVDAEFPHLGEETRNTLKQQALHAHNFLINRVTNNNGGQ